MPAHGWSRLHNAVRAHAGAAGFPPSAQREAVRRTGRARSRPTHVAWSHCRLALPLLLLCLVACRHEPARPPPPGPTQRQQQTLHALGFVHTSSGWLLNLPDPITFDLNKDTLRPGMRAQIATTAHELLKAHVHHLRVEGHTDNSGPRDFNVDLSMRRAQSVAEAFIADGFARENIVEKGLGPDSPIASNDTREGRSSNRCVLIIIPVDALTQ